MPKLSATELWGFSTKYVKNRTWTLSDDDIDAMNELAREVRAERGEQENAEV